MIIMWSKTLHRAGHALCVFFLLLNPCRLPLYYFPYYIFQPTQRTPLKMPVIHIVLVQVKQAVLSNGFDELKQKCETLKDLPIAKAKATEIKWGPPAYPGRNQGYNWGKYFDYHKYPDGCATRRRPMWEEKPN